MTALPTQISLVIYTIQMWEPTFDILLHVGLCKNLSGWIASFITQVFCGVSSSYWNWHLS